MRAVPTRGSVLPSPGDGRRPRASGRTAALRRSVTALAAVPLFDGFSKRHLRRLAAEADVVAFEPGRAIVEEGRPGEAMFVVLSGRRSGRRGGRKVATLVPGDFFGELSALDGGPRTASIVRRHADGGPPAVPAHPPPGGRAGAGPRDGSARGARAAAPSGPARHARRLTRFRRGASPAPRASRRPARRRPRRRWPGRGSGCGSRRSPRSRPAGGRSRRARAADSAQPSRSAIGRSRSTIASEPARSANGPSASSSPAPVAVREPGVGGDRPVRSP